MTSTDIITSAMRLFSGIDAGGAPSASELADGLTMLNDILDSWSAERLNLFAYLTAPYSLVTGTSTYTIGTGAVFNVRRPIRVISAGILIPNSQGAGNFRFPVDILRAEQWAIETVEKGAKAVVPRKLYYDDAFPLGVVNLYPTPTFTGTAQVELYTLQPLTSFPDLVTDIAFPPSYARALRFNLAVSYAPEFGTECSASVINTAEESKAALRSNNLAALTGQDPPAGPVSAIPQGGA